MKQESKLSPTQAHVLAVLKSSKGNITRAEMQREMFGTYENKNKDRLIRKALQSLRNIGFVIVSNSKESGYRLANTQAEVDHYVNERIKAAREMIATARKVKKAYQLRGQMRLAGVK